MTKCHTVKPKIFHLDDWDSRSLNSKSFYDGSGVKRKTKKYFKAEKYWGHIVTNKKGRSDRDFAWIFSPDGDKVNSLNHTTFKMFVNHFDHIYIITSETVNCIAREVADKLISAVGSIGTCSVLEKALLISKEKQSKIK